MRDRRCELPTSHGEQQPVGLPRCVRRFTVPDVFLPYRFLSGHAGALFCLALSLSLSLSLALFLFANLREFQRTFTLAHTTQPKLALSFSLALSRFIVEIAGGHQLQTTEGTGVPAPAERVFENSDVIYIHVCVCLSSFSPLFLHFFGARTCEFVCVCVSCVPCLNVFMFACGCACVGERDDCVCVCTYTNMCREYNIKLLAAKIYS